MKRVCVEEIAQKPGQTFLLLAGAMWYAYIVSVSECDLNPLNFSIFFMYSEKYISNISDFLYKS